MPIRAPRETTNRIKAHVNVGTCTGEKAGAVTSVWRMMNTFKQFSRFGEISEKDPSNRAARREDICPIYMPMSVARRTHSGPDAAEQGNPVVIVSEAFSSEREHGPSDLSSVGSDKA